MGGSIVSKQVVALRLHKGMACVSGGDGPIQITLPQGCVGLLMCFKTKKAARAFWGNEVKMQEFERIEDE